MKLPTLLKVVLGLLALTALAEGTVVRFLVDWMWFDALGYEAPFLRMFAARAGLGAAVFVLAVAFLALNLRFALRQAPINYARLALLLAETGLAGRQVQRAARFAAGALVVLFAFFLAMAAAHRWLDLLAFMAREPFGRADPVFGHDIGFYFFVVPLLRAARGTLLALVLGALLGCAFVYVARDVVIRRDAPRLSAAARAHVLSLGALVMLIAGAGYWLDRFELLFRQRGAVFGPGYADVHAQIPALWAMVAISVASALVLALSAFGRGWRRPAITVGAWMAASIVVVGILPGVVQDWVVRPNELELEKPFLANNIQATREAYALDRIEVQAYEAETGLTIDDIESNQLIVDNIRLWDHRPLLATYAQLQEMRLYYDFQDVDIDRYTIGGQPRQVMLSARELNYANVPTKARSWVNEHFQYTHGYGLTMSPVNLVTTEGLPDLFIRDIPPVSTVGLEVERPEIYFGELTDRYVFVRTGAEEFDYPAGDDNKYTTYAGEGGVPVGSLWRQLVFSLHFGSLDLLLSKYIRDDSRVMFRRLVGERPGHIAPYLAYDDDPYLVLAEGRLSWMIDAYTVGDRYPYSEPHRTSHGSSFNYIRNAVKVVIDAYDGSTRFYVADETDPVVRVYARLFPEVLRPYDEMPPAIRAHVRYPADFFDVQAELFLAYHMQDPTVFYNREDMWQFPREMYGGQEQAMESYYLVTRLHDSDQAEFILLMPFTPTNRDNMISWLAARSDPPHQGSLVLYQFPKQKLIYGPRQVEARIDQDPEISELITLWSQAGSQVVRGNLLVIPIAGSLMYVEPLYLQAESGKLPELKRIIVSYESRLAMCPTLEEALAAVFGVGAPPPIETAGEPAAPGGAATESWQALVALAAGHLAAAESAQRTGDWAAYGAALALLEEAFGRLKDLAQAPAEAAPPTPP